MAEGLTVSRTGRATHPNIWGGCDDRGPTSWPCSPEPGLSQVEVWSVWLRYWQNHTHSAVKGIQYYAYSGLYSTQLNSLGEWEEELAWVLASLTSTFIPDWHGLLQLWGNDQPLGLVGGIHSHGNGQINSVFSEYGTILQPYLTTCNIVYPVGLFQNASTLWMLVLEDSAQLGFIYSRRKISKENSKVNSSPRSLLDV